MGSYRRLEDGTVWPSPDDPREVAYRLRYGGEISEADRLVAASVFAAYRELVTQTQRRRNEVCRMMRAES